MVSILNRPHSGAEPAAAQPVLRALVLALVLALRFAVPGRAQDSLPASPIEVYFLDVGQGDAVLIRTLEGHAALIDAGPGRAIVPYLRRLGITSLDLLVTSHPHKDHIGGIIPMLQTVSVAAYLDNGQRYHSDEYGFLERILHELGTPRLQPVAQTLRLGRATLRVLPPPGNGWSTNNRSVGILLEYGAFRALFTGDSEREELAWFLGQGIPRVTLLKAAHHGALNGVNPGWVQALRPEVVVIQVGRNNKFGHPDPLALRYYRRYAEAVFRTDLHGTVRITGHAEGTWTADTEVD